MDAAVQETQRPDTAVRAGRIIVVRHGRPALDREAGPRLDWRAYRDWWAKYEASSLAEGQKAPDELKKLAAGAVLFSSMRPRAMETAAMIAGGRDVKSDAIFNEAPLPPPQWDSHRYLPKNWNKLARLAWLMGHHGGEEKASATRQRAAKAAQVLAETAGAGKDVVLAAHGWFNRMMRPHLLSRGWKCVKDGGDAYWSFRIYEKRT
jgi:broad specificity phosphatase PhoE